MRNSISDGSLLDFFSRSHPYLSSLIVAFERIRLRWILLLTILCAAWYVYPDIVGNIQSWNRKVIPSWESRPDLIKPGEMDRTFDIDARLIHNGLLAAPRFRDTLHWWTGIWVGKVPFYRPLSSLLFWVEWKLWGDHEPRYALIANLLHLAAVGSLAWCAFNLWTLFRLPTPKLGVVFSILIFTSHLDLIPVALNVNDSVFAWWKNQPDSLCLLFFTLSLSFYIRQMLRDDAGSTAVWLTLDTPPIRSSGPSRWSHINLSLAMLCYLACCSSKESGVFLPLLLLGMEGRNLLSSGVRRRTALTRILPMLAALPLFLIYRAWCLGSFIGYRYGSGASWRYDFCVGALGSVSQAITQGRWTVVALAGGLLAEYGFLVFAYRRLFSRTQNRLIRLLLMPSSLLITLLTVGLAFVLFGGEDYSSLAVTLIVLLAPANMSEALRVTFCLILILIAFVRRTQMAATLYTWNLLSLALIVFSPVVMHRFYLQDAGLALLLAGGFILWLAPQAPAIPVREEEESNRNRKLQQACASIEMETS